jgi:hypothetical protein
MKKGLWISAFLLVFLFTTGIASARVSFGFFLPPVVIGPPVIAPPPPAYYAYPYGYYGYGPAYGRVWVPGYWERVWTAYG